MDVLKVLEPGPFTMVQDLGRFGHQRFGIPVSGALDRFSCRIANLLVGNPESAAVLEVMTLEAEVLTEADVALCGADIPLLLNGERQENWRSLRVRSGDVLSLKTAERGLWGYLAVSGGIDVPEVMGSRSTYAPAKLGGFQGRALAEGDVLRRGESPLLDRPKELPAAWRPTLETNPTFRALPGPQDDLFDEGTDVFFSSEYSVSVKSNRMGYRLKGPCIPLKEGVPKSIISEPCLAGGVQIPADGQPIILLIEQTVGGYAKIATVITPDIERVAQTRAGDKVRFQKVTLSEAHEAYRQNMARLEKFRDFLS